MVKGLGHRVWGSGLGFEVLSLMGRSNVTEVGDSTKGKGSSCEAAGPRRWAKIYWWRVGNGQINR